MKILLINPQSPKDGLSDQFLQVLKETGNDILYINERTFWLMPPGFRQIPFLWRHLRRIGFIRQRNKELLQKKILQAVDRFKPQLLIVVQGVSIETSTISAIAAKGVITANWFFENQTTDFRKEWFKNIESVYDHLFTFDPIIARQGTHGRTKLHYLPVAVDPRLFENPQRPNSVPTICFIGAHEERREKLLSRVADLGLEIYGWKGWEKTSLAHLYRGPASLHETAKLYAFSALNMNINSVPACGGITLRTFEISAAGGFQISDVRDGLRDCFSEQEVPSFSDDDVREKVVYWLKHPEERALAAAAAHKRFLRDHTMAVRVQTLLDAVKS